jgi:hypothetical protein
VDKYGNSILDIRTNKNIVVYIEGEDIRGCDIARVQCNFLKK